MHLQHLQILFCGTTQESHYLAVLRYLLQLLGEDSRGLDRRLHASRLSWLCLAASFKLDMSETLPLGDILEKS